MHLTGSRSFKAPRQEVWNTLLNPDQIAHCMPGCQSFDPLGPDEYRATMTVKVASIGGSFTGKIALTDKQEPTGYGMRVEGQGKPGRASGAGMLKLEETDSGTLVSYEGDVQIAGAIAAVGQRLLGVTAKMMIGKFFDCMETRLKETT
jgi:carbon monoxide dehydrogenase subunit G